MGIMPVAGIPLPVPLLRRLGHDQLLRRRRHHGERPCPERPMSDGSAGSVDVPPTPSCIGRRCRPPRPATPDPPTPGAAAAVSGPADAVATDSGSVTRRPPPGQNPQEPGPPAVRHVEPQITRATTITRAGAAPASHRSDGRAEHRTIRPSSGGRRLPDGPGFQHHGRSAQPAPLGGPPRIGVAPSTADLLHRLPRRGRSSPMPCAGSPRPVRSPMNCSAASSSGSTSMWWPCAWSAARGRSTSPSST